MLASKSERCPCCCCHPQPQNIRIKGVCHHVGLDFAFLTEALSWKLGPGFPYTCQVDKEEGLGCFLELPSHISSAHNSLLFSNMNLLLPWPCVRYCCCCCVCSGDWNQGFMLSVCLGQPRHHPWFFPNKDDFLRFYRYSFAMFCWPLMRCSMTTLFSSVVVYGSLWH